MVILKELSFMDMGQVTLGKISKLLGLSLFELEIIQPELHTDKIGKEIIGYTIIFKSNAPRKILNKINNLRIDNTVIINCQHLVKEDYFLIP